MTITSYLCEISYINIGIFIIIFIIILSLVIFAPKSKNFYNNDIFPIVDYLYKNNDDVFIKDLQLIKNDETKNNLWIKYPDKEYIINTYLIYPIYIYGLYSYKRYILSMNTSQLINTIPNIKGISYLKLNQKSKIKKRKKWKEISNNTLCCLFVLESVYTSNPEECCIWVNGEIKPLVKNKLIIYDSSKEHSIINDTDSPVYLLELDIKKPKELAFGTSDRTFNDDIKKIIKKIKKENKLFKKKI